MRTPLVRYHFATAPFWISLYMRKIFFSFLSVCWRGVGLPFSNYFLAKEYFLIFRDSFHYISKINFASSEIFFSCEAYLQTRRMRLPSSRWRSAPPSSSAHGSCTSTLTRWLVVIEPIVTCNKKFTMESVVKLRKKNTLTNVVFYFFILHIFIS